MTRSSGRSRWEARRREYDVSQSVARGESKDVSDVDFLVDFLIEMDENVSAFGVGAFQYEVQQLLGTKIDVIPTFALKNVDDQAFVHSVRSDSVAI